MWTVLVVAVLLAVAFLLNLLWTRQEARREAKAQRVVDDMASMGDEVVPDSIHPFIDPYVCIGSGGCVRACPEKEVIALVGGQAQLINPLGCIGHGACARACPVDAIKLVFGTASRGVELPEVDPRFETNQGGVYVIGELGGMGLIRNAVSQGAQAAQAVAESDRRGGGDVLDALVVGAGPAGISATLGLMQAGLRVLLVDREAFGGTITHYPRAKVVMTGALDLPLYGRVKRRTMSKEQLVELWNDIRDKTKLEVVTGELVEALEAQPDGTWNVRTSKETRRAASVLLALGRRGSPRKLGVPGEELAKVSYRLLEPDPFRGKHVLVVGGGNSAVESALALADDGKCASVAISYRRTEFARCRGENRRRIAELIGQGKVRSLLPTNVRSIGERDVVLAWDDGREERIENDAVIVQAGGTAPAKLLASFGIRTVTKYGEA